MSGAWIRENVRAMRAYVPGEQPDGADVLKLNTNENPYPPSPKVFEALGSITADTLRKYPHPTGRALREALAELHGVQPEQVFVGNGSDEVLALCTRAFGPANGRVGYMSPSYSLYPVLCDIAGLEKVEMPLNVDFSWTVPGELDVDLFFLTRPNAPTGLSVPLEDVKAAATRCRGVFVVDEAYADFADDDAMGLLAECPNLMVTRSFSKSHSLAGVRVGYALAAPELIAAFDKIKDSYNLDAPAQAMALASVRDITWMQTNVTAVRGTRADTTRRLEALGFQVIPSQTNFVFARVPEGREAKTIYQTLRDRRVFVRWFDTPRTRDHLRVTIGTDPQMERFFKELEAILQPTTGMNT